MYIHNNVCFNCHLYVTQYNLFDSVFECHLTFNCSNLVFLCFYFPMEIITIMSIVNNYALYFSRCVLSCNNLLFHLLNNIKL